MTPDQLAALMKWVNDRIVDSVEQAGDESVATRRTHLALYQEFGFEEGPMNEPAAPGTWPPTTGGR